MFRSKGSAKGQNGHPCAAARENACGCVLDHNTTAAGNSEAIRGLQIPFRIWFSVEDIARADQVWRSGKARAFESYCR